MTERRGAVAIVTMNMPERRNALSPELRGGLVHAFDDLTADGECRAIVLTGTASSFCAGGDLSSLPSRDPAASRARMAHSHGLLRTIVCGPKPVVAAVNGNAFGAGMSLALACDYVVGSPGTRFCSAFAKVGLMADLALGWSLARRVTPGEAKRILFAAPVTGGEEALASRLLDRLVPDERLLDEAIAVAVGFAAAPPLAVGLTKAHMTHAASLDEALSAELDGQALLFSSEDFEEGRAAFLEKRRPVFKGR
nr:enoyl-CoA hydratase-related protein [Enterovirga sp. DB1703]